MSKWCAFSSLLCVATAQGPFWTKILRRHHRHQLQCLRYQLQCRRHLLQYQLHQLRANDASTSFADISTASAHLGIDSAHASAESFCWLHVDGMCNIERIVMPSWRRKSWSLLLIYGMWWWKCCVRWTAQILKSVSCLNFC